MHYDLLLINELCMEMGLASTIRQAYELAIELDPGIVLLFENTDHESDCMMSFEGTVWHTHGDLCFADRCGSNINMDYLDVIIGIANGTILICELWVQGELADRWIVHRDYVDEFGYLQNGDELRMRPVSPQGRGRLHEVLHR